MMHSQWQHEGLPRRVEVCETFMKLHELHGLSLQVLLSIICAFSHSFKAFFCALIDFTTM